MISIMSNLSRIMNFGIEQDNEHWLGMIRDKYPYLDVGLPIFDGVLQILEVVLLNWVWAWSTNQSPSPAWSLPPPSATRWQSWGWSWATPSQSRASCQDVRYPSSSLNFRCYSSVGLSLTDQTTEDKISESLKVCSSGTIWMEEKYEGMFLAHP